MTMMLLYKPGDLRLNYVRSNLVRTSVAFLFLQELKYAKPQHVIPAHKLKVYAVGVPPADARWLRLRLRPRRPGAAVVPVARDAPLPCAVAREACAASVASRSSFVSSGRSELRSVTCHACVGARTTFRGIWMARVCAYRVRVQAVYSCIASQCIASRRVSAGWV